MLALCTYVAILVVMLTFVCVYIAAQMWTLATNLPLMIGYKVPPSDQKWECYLLLLDILQLCTSKASSSALAGFLEGLIYQHHHLFVGVILVAV